MAACVFMTAALALRYQRSLERWNRHSYIMFERLVAVRVVALPLLAALLKSLLTISQYRIFLNWGLEHVCGGTA